MDHKLAVFTIKGIVKEDHPILYVVHDEDGSWQFLDGATVNMSDMMIVGLSEILQLDPTIEELMSMKPGSEANRESLDCPWRISQRS